MIQRRYREKKDGPNSWEINRPPLLTGHVVEHQSGCTLKVNMNCPMTLLKLDLHRFAAVRGINETVHAIDAGCEYHSTHLNRESPQALRTFTDPITDLQERSTHKAKSA